MHKNQPYYVKQNSIHGQKRMNTIVYYLFPKCSLERSVISFNPLDDRIISPSQFHYMNEIKTRIQECGKWSKLSVHPYANIHNISYIPNVNLVFYEILELYSIMHFSWSNFHKLHTLHFGIDGEMTEKAFRFIRNYSKNDASSLVGQRGFKTGHKIDIAFCHASSDNEQENGKEILDQLLTVLVSQKQKGACIVKIGDTFTQLSLDIISFLSHFYEKTYILKPSICDLTTCDKYIVCKNFLYEHVTDDVLRMHSFLKTQPHTRYIYRIFEKELPLFISGKMEEINSIFGQPRLEYIHQLLGSQTESSNENRANKQKCVDWCGKYLDS
jgi:hypothetical protein